MEQKRDPGDRDEDEIYENEIDDDENEGSIKSSCSCVR